VITDGVQSDFLTVMFKGPSPFPQTNGNTPAAFKMNVAAGKGEQYCKDVFNFNPRVYENKF
jgi:hypothetical protein